MNEEKFSGKSKIYSLFRPGYPDEFIDMLYKKAYIAENSVIADIGSGTGKLTEQLLKRGNTVYGVEPNEDMRKTGEENLKKFKSFISVNGTAENTLLPDESTDAVTAAQAFHWFHRGAFKKECKRILKESGRVIIIWNMRDESAPVTIENKKINREFCPGFKDFSAGSGNDREKTNLSDFFTGGYITEYFDNPYVFDRESFIGRCLSSSYALKEEDKNYSDYINALSSLFDRFQRNSVLTVPNTVCCYIGSV